MEREDIFIKNEKDMTVKSYVNNLTTVLGRLFFDNELIGDLIVRYTKDINRMYCQPCDQSGVIKHPCTEQMFIYLWVFHFITNTTLYTHFMNNTLSCLYEQEVRKNNFGVIRHRVNKAPLYTRTSYLYNIMCKFTDRILTEMAVLFDNDNNDMILKPSLLYNDTDFKDLVIEFFNISFYNRDSIPKGCLLTPISLCYLYELWLASSFEELYIQEFGVLSGIDHTFKLLLQNYKNSFIYHNTSCMYNHLYYIESLHERLIQDTTNVNVLSKYAYINKNNSCVMSLISFQARAHILYLIIYKQLISFVIRD